MPLTPIIDNARIKKLTDEPKFGTVIFNDDPERLGRIKVNIPGIFEGNTDQLPWIRRKQDTSFCGADCEVFDVPEIGSVVEVKWNYDENTPMYSGAPYSKKHTSSIFTNNYPYEGGIKFGKMYIKFDKGTNLMTISNGTTFIQCDPMGKISIVAGGDIDLKTKGSINYTATNHNFVGNVIINGGLYCSQAANGTIDPTRSGTVSGGIVVSIQ